MICLNDSKTVASQCTIAQCPKQHLLIGINYIQLTLFETDCVVGLAPTGCPRELSAYERVKSNWIGRLGVYM